MHRHQHAESILTNQQPTAFFFFSQQTFGHIIAREAQVELILLTMAPLSVSDNDLARLKQLNGTFHSVLILAVPLDKGGSVSPTCYMFPPLHSPLQGDYLAGRKAAGSSRDGPSVSSWRRWNSAGANPANQHCFVWFHGKIRPSGRH